MLKRLLSFGRAHKILSVLVIVGLGYGGYVAYTKATFKPAAPRYVLAQAERTTLVSSISGSGQVSAYNQIDVVPKASGDLLSVTMKEGQEVKAGTVLARLDATEALVDVRDAEDALVSAQLSLERAKEPADGLTVLKAEHGLADAKEAREDAVEDLSKSYEDGYDDVVEAYLRLPVLLDAFKDVMRASTLNGSQSNADAYADAIRRYDPLADTALRDVESKYDAAREAYDEGFRAYKVASRDSSESEIESLIDLTREASRTMAAAAKSAIDLIHFYQDELTERNLKTFTQTEAHIDALGEAQTTANGLLAGLLNAGKAIDAARQSIASSERRIAEQEGSLSELKEGPDALDVRGAELTVRQRQNALREAQEKLADYAVRAPFDGVIVGVEAVKGDAVGASTVLAKLVTHEKVAEISLNEVDIAKIKIGQKAVLTFDAVSDLTISGEVAHVDALGASSQGVVTYGVKIAFDTDDERVKSAMTANASIIVEAKTDVLAVPAAAVKTQGTASYVEAVAAPPENASSSGVELPSPPERRTVEVGATNDEYVEILSGLNEGETVVTRTVQAAATTASAPTQGANALFGGGVGGGTRIMTGGGGGGGFAPPR